MLWIYLSYKPYGWRRSLTAGEDQLLADHLLRLPAEDRRARFLHEMGEDAIRDHARIAGGADRRVIGWFRDGVMRGAIELHFSGDIAEAALTVEPEHRGAGVALGLMRSGLRAAGNRGGKRVVVRTSQSNAPMLTVARAAGARFFAEDGDLTGEIHAAAPTPGSLVFDCAEERNGRLASIAADFRNGAIQRLLRPGG